MPNDKSLRNTTLGLCVNKDENNNNNDSFNRKVSADFPSVNHIIPKINTRALTANRK